MTSNNVLQVVTSGVAIIERRSNDPDSMRKAARLIDSAASRGASITERPARILAQRPRALRRHHRRPDARRRWPRSCATRFGAPLPSRLSSTSATRRSPSKPSSTNSKRSCSTWPPTHATPCRRAAPSPSAPRAEGPTVRSTAGTASASLCSLMGARRRSRHGRRHSRSRHRAVLHDQTRRQGNRPRPVDGQDLCRGSRRAPECRKPARIGHDRPSLATPLTPPGPPARDRSRPRSRYSS